MSERKVLNKYYPPDFDPAKIPRLRLPKDRQYTVRLMAPCNMRCTTCGEYIYKGKKFNARKETVSNEEYLGIKVFRFYIKCPRCLAEITFKTDPENADYIVEHGATRNFQALKLAEEQAEREAKELEEEEKSNPMKLLENRTKASKQEMDVLESLEDLKDLNQRHAKVDFEKMLMDNYKVLEASLKAQEDEDEAMVKAIFSKVGDEKYKRIVDDDENSDEESGLKRTLPALNKPTDILTIGIQPKKPKWEEEQTSSGIGKKQLLAMVKRKTTPAQEKQVISSPTLQNANSNPTTSSSANNSLALLGAYSGSDDSDS